MEAVFMPSTFKVTSCVSQRGCSIRMNAWHTASLAGGNVEEAF